MEIWLLGPLEIVGDGRPVALGGPKERRVLALLAAHANQVVAEERICEAIWGDEQPRTALSTLRTHISRLRKVLGNGLAIVTTSGGYRLEAAPGATDVAGVEALATGATNAATAGDWARASEAFADALSRFRGPVLPELAGTALGVGPIARLEELRASLAEGRVEAELAQGHHGSAVGELEGLCAAYPLREGLWAARMLALYRAGRPAEALRAYQDLRHHLGEELGLEPSAELVGLEARILAQDSALAWASPPTPGLDPVFEDTSRQSLPSGVVTFLLTDIEGSTRLWDDDAAAMGPALERHDRVMADAVGNHGGNLLKARGEGDATFSVFRRATDATSAALWAQAALASEPWPAAARLRVRMSIYTGEAIERDGDYYGPTVNRAARLRSLAAGGQVLVSQSAAEVIVDHLPDGVSLHELGAQVLKDLARRERVFALVGQGLDVPVLVAKGTEPEATEPEPVARPFPAALTVDPAAPFVGREAELVRLESLSAEAREGARRTVLIGGEPGVGKTRLVADAATRAHAEGALVLYGRCDEDLGVPHQPFAEALGAYLGMCAPDVLRAQAGTRAGELVRLLPEVGSYLPGLAPPVSAEPETERYLLFEAVGDLISGIAEQTSVVLVLDDLHWATKPTLLMLRHLLKRPDVALLVLCTYRDTELDRAHPLAEMLADLRRQPGVERITLRGLSEPAVLGYLKAAAGESGLDPRTAELAQALWAETEGNPFFIGEVLAHLVESGVIYDQDGRWTSEPGVAVSDLGLPEGVKEVIVRRLARLSETANRALTAASVIGPTFDVRLLEGVCELDPDVVLEGLEEAATAGLLTESGAGYAFAHALIRQTLYSEVSGPRRMRLHRKIAEVIEARPNRDAQVAALAFHFAEAALDGCTTQAADYALAAGGQALEHLAYEEAIRLLQRGRVALELEEPIDRGRRAELLLALAEAHYRASFQIAAWHGLASAAADDARATGSAEQFARAAVLRATGCLIATPDPEAPALCEEALRMLGPQDLAARARVLNALGHYRDWVDNDRVAAAALSQEAYELGVQVGDHETVLEALFTKHAALLGQPEVVDQRLAIAEEMVRAAERTGNVRLIQDALGYRGESRLEALDRAGFDQDVAALEAISSGAVRDPGDLDAMVAPRQALQAALDGRLAEAEAIVTAVIERLKDTGPGTLSNFGAQLLFIWLEQGRLAEARDLMEAVAEAHPGVVTSRAGMVRLDAELGHWEQARDGLAILVADDLVAVPRGAQWPWSLAFLAAACAKLRDADTATTLLGHLLPFAGQLIGVSPIMCFGAADRFLGLLAATLDRRDEAEAYFRAALELESRIGGRLLMPRTQLCWAQLLFDRGAPGDHARGTDLAQAAFNEAEAMGMSAVATEAKAVLNQFYATR